jgi:hypothetical protein
LQKKEKRKADQNDGQKFLHFLHSYTLQYDSGKTIPRVARREFLKGKTIMGKTMRNTNAQQKTLVKMIEVKMIKSDSMILTLLTLMILTFSFKPLGINTGHSH